MWKKRPCWARPHQSLHQTRRFRPLGYVSNMSRFIRSGSTPSTRAGLRKGSEFRRRRDVTLGNPQPAAASAHGRKIGVVGLGYVGIATALSFTDEGANVVGLDVSETRLSAIKDVTIDILPRDKVRLRNALDSNLLRATTERSAVGGADLVVICVPTPVDDHLTPDLTALSAACRTVVSCAKPGQVIVLTSTTYVGCTADLLIQPLQCRGLAAGKDIFVAFSPERIDPGVADHAPEKTPRVLGGATPECAARASKFLEHTASSIHTVSSPEAAELTKLLENTFRAVNIAMINEFADAARQSKVDIAEVIEAASTKPYGFMPFFPGPGVGGHCIPCDPHYFLWQLRAQRVNSPVVDAAMKAIAARPGVVAARAREILGVQGIPLGTAKVLVLGVSYKPGVGDIRESPALEILDSLSSECAQVSYSDPYVESISTPRAGQLSSIEKPNEWTWDLVVIHTLHPDVDYSWLEGRRAVLDATFRSQLPHAHVV